MDKIDELKKLKCLGNIKSSYIIMNVFSFLEKKQKLNLIIYNKKFQKIFGVGFEDYREISKIYRIVDINGNGGDYIKDTEKLIFVGEYLNGKKRKKGKEYDFSGKLEFEGEYLNGKRWNGNGYDKKNNIVAYKLTDGNGYVKEYHVNGELKFEGEYLNGEKNGKGKEYNLMGMLRFEGEYLNGERNGKGKEYHFNGDLVFEGEFIKGKRWNEK